METTPFDLTPEQKGLLQSLSQETGKPISALIAEALQGLER
jgi:predicted DNA-binding protein